MAAKHLRWVLACTFVVSYTIAASSDPEPPVWPKKFSADLFQNRTGALAKTVLLYDWENGRNLNIITKQQGGHVWDMEWTNGTSFYVDVEAETCKVIKFPVGILAPDWLKNATFLGNETVDTKPCYKWAKADFITYWSSIETGDPVRWRFFNGAQFEVMAFLPDKLPVPPQVWQAPSYCFNDEKLIAQ